MARWPTQTWGAKENRGAPSPSSFPPKEEAPREAAARPEAAQPSPARAAPGGGVRWVQRGRLAKPGPQPRPPPRPPPRLPGPARNPEKGARCRRVARPARARRSPPGRPGREEGGARRPAAWPAPRGHRQALLPPPPCPRWWEIARVTRQLGAARSAPRRGGGGQVRAWAWGQLLCRWPEGSGGGQELGDPYCLWRPGHTYFGVSKGTSSCPTWSTPGQGAPLRSPQTLALEGGAQEARWWEHRDWGGWGDTVSRMGLKQGLMSPSPPFCSELSSLSISYFVHFAGPKHHGLIRKTLFVCVCKFSPNPPIK